MMAMSGLILLSAGPVMADSYTAGLGWGAVNGGVAVSGAYESAAMHAQNGITAGQVNAARKRSLVSTGSQGTIQSIGSQTIVSSTIQGDRNTINQNPTQNAENSGAVTNHSGR
ncbi:hypothetical protein [Rhizobium sp. SSA_523]|uniref:hypothetical protein n=1 Tax=Rhizobium sp. SSA_523 TaxID=2952477 RepID=UPI002090F8E7|nr:hypothetical protein [Rhizobium sp. SSA_523]MCO5730497.1 hypothetical protein [Rhizobium sp. SSA_523]WKC25536.1 hypothetical protein QTJ18_16380 [Rhizobium sp. SSA_523]